MIKWNCVKAAQHLRWQLLCLFAVYLLPVSHSQSSQTLLPLKMQLLRDNSQDQIENEPVEQQKNVILLIFKLILLHSTTQKEISTNSTSKKVGGKGMDRQGKEGRGHNRTGEEMDGIHSNSWRRKWKGDTGHKPECVTGWKHEKQQQEHTSQSTWARVHDRAAPIVDSWRTNQCNIENAVQCMIEHITGRELEKAEAREQARGCKPKNEWDTRHKPEKEIASKTWDKG